MDKLIKYKLKRGIKKKGHILLGVAFFMAFLLGVVATFIYVWKNVVASIVNFSLLLIILQ